MMKFLMTISSSIHSRWMHDTYILHNPLEKDGFFLGENPFRKMMGHFSFCIFFPGCPLRVANSSQVRPLSFGFFSWCKNQMGYYFSKAGNAKLQNTRISLVAFDKISILAKKKKKKKRAGSHFLGPVEPLWLRRTMHLSMTLCAVTTTLFTGLKPVVWKVEHRWLNGSQSCFFPTSGRGGVVLFCGMQL